MMFQYENFKGSNGKTKTKSLFYELCYSDTEDAVFTLKDRDLEAHGKMNVSNASGVKTHIARWRKEVEVKVKSEAIKAIAEEMKTKGRSSFSAAKLLLDKGWLDKEAATVAKTKLKAKEDEDMNKEALSLLSDDAKRLGLTRAN